MSETVVNYTVPPTHFPKRCLRCGSDLEWMCDGSLGHVGRKAPQSDWAVCLERQLVNVKAQAEELRKRANQEAEYLPPARLRDLDRLRPHRQGPQRRSLSVPTESS